MDISRFQVENEGKGNLGGPNEKNDSSEDEGSIYGPGPYILCFLGARGNKLRWIDRGSRSIVGTEFLIPNLNIAPV